MHVVVHVSHYVVFYTTLPYLFIHSSHLARFSLIPNPRHLWLHPIKGLKGVSTSLLQLRFVAFDRPRAEHLSVLPAFKQYNECLRKYGIVVGIQSKSWSFHGMLSCFRAPKARLSSSMIHTMSSKYSYSIHYSVNAI